MFPTELVSPIDQFSQYIVVEQKPYGNDGFFTYLILDKKTCKHNVYLVMKQIPSEFHENAFYIVKNNFLLNFKQAQVFYPHLSRENYGFDSD